MEERITLKTIARMAGVSTTTVYKALNGKSKISGEMEKKILAIAKAHNYVPNRSAQSLSRKKKRVVALINQYPAEFQNDVIRGCRHAFESCRDYKIETSLKTYPTTESWREIRAVLDKCIKDKVDGIIIEPGYETDQYMDLLTKAADLGIAIVTLVTDIPGLARKCAVSVNTKVVGHMAAQILKMNVQENAPVVLFAGKKEMDVHKSYITAFQEMADQLRLNLVNIYETMERYDLAYALTESVLNEFPGLGGIYVSSYNSVGVCDCLKANGLDGKIKVVGQDLYQKLAERLKDGSLTAAIYQDPYQQGAQAVLKMAEFLNTGWVDAADIRITPQLVLTSNLDCYTNYIV